MVDLEVRGVPALSYFGNVVWKDVYDQMNTGGCVRRGSGTTHAPPQPVLDSADVCHKHPLPPHSPSPYFP